MASSLGDNFTTYKQYKEDTESIAGWLAKNALRCGYKIPSTAAGPASQPPTARLKGKARKEARNATKAPAKPSSTGPRYTIAVSDFVYMAKAIADHKPKVTIPTALDNLFNRAIEARRRCTQWYEEHLHNVEDSNRRHAHFTGILTTAWETLRPFKEARASRSTSRSALDIGGTDKPLVELMNRFSGLDVEHSADQDPEPEQAGASEPDEDDYQLTDVAPVVVVRGEEDIEDDFIFAIFVFMEELSDVRDFIRRLWASYRDGVGELMLSSLLTNTALQLVRRAEHELDLMIERPKKYPASSYPVWTFPGIFMYEMHGNSTAKAHSLDDFIKPSALISQFGCSHAELCLWVPYSALKYFLYEVQYRGKQYLVPDSPENVDNPKMSEDFRRLKRMLPCFQGISNAMDNSFANDEITSGVGVALKTETVPIWAAFGLQLLLDMQDELRTAPDKALKEVKQHARARLGDIRRRKLDQPPFAVVGESTAWLRSTMDAYELDILGDNFRRTLGGGILDRRTMRPASFNLDDLKNVPGIPEFLREPDAFLRYNYVKCGMLKYGLHLHTHHYAVGFEFTWRGITSMVHLYVACRSLFPDDPVWPDMEFFLQHQDLDNLFLGGLPSSMEEAYKKYLLSVGVRASNFARNRRDLPPKLNLDKGRWVSNPCLLDEIYKMWMCGGKVMTDDMVSELARTIADPKAIARKAHQAGLPARVGEAFIRAWSSNKSSSSSSSSDHHNHNHGRNCPHHRISTMTTTLENMAFYVTTEAADLYFDWLSFAETCQRMWTRIYDALDALRAEDPGRKANTRTPHMAVEAILDEARTMQRVAEDILGGKDSGGGAAVVDVPAFLREEARGAAVSWDVIRSISSKGMKVSFGSRGSGGGGGDDDGDGGRFHDVKAWVGDQELFRVRSKALGESIYPNLTPSLARTIYRNWPVDDVRRSAVLRMR